MMKEVALSACSGKSHSNAIRNAEVVSKLARDNQKQSRTRHARPTYTVATNLPRKTPTQMQSYTIIDKPNAVLPCPVVVQDRAYVVAA